MTDHDYDLQAPMCEDAEAGQGVPLPGRGREAGARDPRRPGQEEEEEEVSVKLLPCPFCGGEAKFVKTSDEIVPGRVELVAWNVKCSRCFASPLPNNYEGSKEAAAERWNRRAERTSARNIAEACGETFGSIRNRELAKWGTSIVPKETIVNRDALLALADEMERRADLPSLTVAGQDLVFSEFLVGYARRVRKACGEGA